MISAWRLGVNGTSAAFDEGSISFDNLFGIANFSNNDISGGLEDNINVLNTSGSLTMEVSNSTIGLNSTASGNDGILVEAQNAAFVDLFVHDSTFLGSRGDHIQTNALGTSTMNVDILDNTFQNAHTNSLGGGVTVSGGSVSSNITVTYDISGTTPGSQTFRDSESNAITVNFVNGGGTADGTIINNAIGLTGVPNSGSASGSGILVGTQKNVTHDVLIDNNTILRVAGFAGIDASASGTSTLNATITGNTIDEMEGSLFAGLYALTGGGASDTSHLCADISGNSITNNVAISFDIFADQISGAASSNYPGYVGPTNGGAALDAFLASQNTLGGVGGADTSVALNVGGVGTTCP